MSCYVINVTHLIFLYNQAMMAEVSTSGKTTLFTSNTAEVLALNFFVLGWADWLWTSFFFPFSCFSLLLGRNGPTRPYNCANLLINFELVL
jgi:hypothetical protein